jgi:hypothetical protein
VQHADGRPMALLANYSTHYAGSPALSADYFAVFVQRIGELLQAGPEFIGIMSNGASGDANCIDFTNPERKFTCRTVAEEKIRLTVLDLLMQVAAP